MDFSKPIFYTTPYALFVSILYLMGYWSTFAIDIVQYISLPDIIKITLYPLALAFLLVFSGALGGQLIIEGVKKPKHIITIHRIIYILVIGYSLYSIYCDIYITWAWGSVAATALIVWRLGKREVLVKIFPNLNINIKNVLAPFFIALPLLAFSFGKINSHHILIGHNTRFVKTSIIKENNVFSKQEKLKFLGLAGRYVLFLSEDNSRFYSIKSEEIPILEMSKPSKIDTKWFCKLYDTKSKPKN